MNCGVKGEASVHWKTFHAPLALKQCSIELAGGAHFQIHGGFSPSLASA